MEKILFWWIYRGRTRRTTVPFTKPGKCSGRKPLCSLERLSIEIGDWYGMDGIQPVFTFQQVTMESPGILQKVLLFQK